MVIVIITPKDFQPSPDFFMIILQVEACHKHSTKSPISAEEVLDKTSVESLGNTFSIYILFPFLTETVGET